MRKIINLKGYYLGTHLNVCFMFLNRLGVLNASSSGCFTVNQKEPIVIQFRKFGFAKNNLKFKLEIPLPIQIVCFQFGKLSV